VVTDTTAAQVLVYGAGGHGKVVADVGRSTGANVLGFIDDDTLRQSLTVVGMRVIPWQKVLSDGSFRGAGIALGIGDNAARQSCRDRVVDKGFQIATLIHPRAVVASPARVGVGTVVVALAVVNPDATVGEGSILKFVEHDCVLGQFVHMSPNSALGGGVTVGDRTHVGLGAMVLPNLAIGTDVRVGAGAVVIRRVLEGVTVVGAPARPLETK
jgi:sugar O-acyltransferase (sialic acid O-acetyltransferase NeuD family)